ncbi:MAG: UDP-N-acetylmuramoyl-L-alanine--D-glutamate ligase [Opitutales bacterium]
MSHKKESYPAGRIAVFGAGLSGTAALRLAASLGYKACCFDEAGGGDAMRFDADAAAAFDGFVFSPGFAADHPWRRLAESSGKPCFSELGFAASHWRGYLCGVTGTNGKTSVTELLRGALVCAGRAAEAAGNIGRPLSELVLSAANSPETTAVCEISSFQAELLRGLELDALLWTNFAEDHLDRYGSAEAYFRAKAGLFSCLRPEAPVVWGEGVEAWAKHTGVELPAWKRPEKRTVDPARLQRGSPFLQSPQNRNLAIAAQLWECWGLPESALFEAANAFELAPHRLRCVAEWDGVEFWDDSKATNPDAVLAALEGFELPVHWIGGGLPKGGDGPAFARALAGGIHAAFIYGAVGDAFAGNLREEGVSAIYAKQFNDVVKAAAASALASPPAVVLLSPGFASFDCFSNYAERGNSFTTTVLSLKNVIMQS